MLLRAYHVIRDLITGRKPVPEPDWFDVMAEENLRRRQGMN